jgi:tetratricopeptide (TPR) repeat protein
MIAAGGDGWSAEPRRGEGAACDERGEMLGAQPGREADAERAFRDAITAGHLTARRDLALLVGAQAGREAEAEAILSDAIAAGDDLAWNALGTLLGGDPTRWREAEVAYGEAIAAGTTVASNNLGLLLARQPGREREAEAAFRDAIGPECPDAYNNLGWLIAAQPGREGEAETILRRGVLAGSVLAMHNLAWVLARQPGREQDAEQAFRRAIDAGCVRVWNSLGWFLATQPGREDDAEAAYRTAIAASQTRALHNLGVLLARQAGREAEAEALFREAIAAGDTRGWSALGLLLRAQPGRRDEAEAAFREAVAAGEPDAQASLAELLGERHEAVDAGDDVTAEERLQRQIGDSEVVIARIASGTRELAGRRALALALMDKGVALDALGRHAEAIAVYDVVVAQFAADGDAQIAWRVAWALVDKGLALEKLDRPHDAIGAYDEALARIVELPDPEEHLFACASLNRCSALCATGRYQEAIEASALALDHFDARPGDDPEARDRRARVLMLKSRAHQEAGDHHAALMTYDEVLERFSGEEAPDPRRRVAWAMFHRGELLYLDGRHADALQAADTLLDRFGASSDDDERRCLHRALGLKADALRWLDRDAEALVVYGTTYALGERLRTELDEPVYVGWSIRTLLEKASTLQALERRAEAVVAREEAFALIEPPPPEWLHEHVGLALISQAGDLDALGEHDRAAQVPVTTRALLGDADEPDEAAQAARPSDERLAQLLADTLAGDCFEHFTAAAEDRPRELFGARAATLYGETAPVLAGLAHDEDPDEAPIAATLLVRGIADAYALLSRRAPIAEEVRCGLPTRARVGLAISMSGLGVWAENLGQPLPALVVADEDEDQAWETIDAVRAATDQLELDRAALAQFCARLLRTSDVVATILSTRHGRDILRTDSMRDQAGAEIEQGLRWLNLVEQCEPDAMPPIVTMLLIAQSWHVAGWTEAPRHAEWFPSRAFLREILEAPDGLRELTDEAVEFPAWLR